MALQSALLKLYASVNRSGFLENPIVDFFFRKTYFLYKQVCEDNLQAYCRLNSQDLGLGHMLDIGANIGYTASVLSQHLHPQKFSVFAFEPEKKNFQRLLRCITEKNLTRVKPFQVAVGRREGEVSLWENPEHHADHRVCTEVFLPKHASLQKVPLVSIDHFLEGHAPGDQISFVKIDVQGFELEVLKGMEKTLEKNKAIRIFFEYHPPSFEALGFQAEDLLQFFIDRQFTIFFVEKNGKQQEASIHAIRNFLKRKSYLDLLAYRGGIS